MKDLKKMDARDLVIELAETNRQVQFIKNHYEADGYALAPILVELLMHEDRLRSELSHRTIWN